MIRNIARLIFILFVVLLSCNKPLEPLEDTGTTNKTVPVITSLSRTTALPGDTITIYASNIDSTTSVIFGDKIVPITTRTGNSLVVMVPDGVGGIYITLSKGFLRSNKTVFTYYKLPMPAGIQFGGTAYNIDTLAQYPVGPGTTYTFMDFRDIYLGTQPLKVHLITIDASNPYIKMKPVLGRDTIEGRENIGSMANRKSTANQNYFAGVNVNDDLIKIRTSSSDPAYVPGLGRFTYPIMIDYFPIITNSAIAPNVQGYWHAEALFQNGKMYFLDTTNYQGSIQLPSGEEYGLQGFNGPRTTVFSAAPPPGTPTTTINNGNVVIYTPERGRTTRTNTTGYDLICRPEGSLGNFTNVKLRVLRTLLNVGNIRLDTANNWVVSGTGPGQKFLEKAKVGDILTVSAFYSGVKRIQPDQIVGGERFLLQNGEIYSMVTDWTTRLARTAIGASADGYKIYLCVVDGEQPGYSTGVFTTHMAKIMQLFGAYNAINFDGRAFSSMFVKNAGVNGLMNRPAGTTNYPDVMTGLFATSSAPASNTITQVAAQDYQVRLTAGSIYTPVFYGVNQYGHIVQSNLSGVSLSASGAGNVSGGSFTAGTAGSKGTITANYNGMTTNIRVIVE